MRTTLRAAAAIAAKDVRVWARRPSFMAASVLPAIVFMLVILVSAAAVGRNPVALVVLDRGPRAAQLAGILESSDAFRVQEATPAQASGMLADLEVAAVITIPADFDARFDQDVPDPVTIRIDNLNLDFTNDLRRSLPAAITTFYAQQGHSPVAVGVAETDLRAHDVSLVQFNLVPNLVLLLTVAGVVSAGLATAREFEESTVKELLTAPIRPSTVILGKLLAGWVTSLLVAAVVLALGAATGVLRPAGWFWLPAAAAIGLISLASSGLGTAIGARFRQITPTAGVGVNVSIYLFFLSGGISVAAFLPGWVQAVAHVIPTYYGVHALQMAVFYQSTDLLGRDLLVLVATAAAALTLGTLALRRRVAG
jgi:ABC-type multidrug transport system permease subunit